MLWGSKDLYVTSILFLFGPFRHSSDRYSFCEKRPLATAAMNAELPPFKNGEHNSESASTNDCVITLLNKSDTVLARREVIALRVWVEGESQRQTKRMPVRLCHWRYEGEEAGGHWPKRQEKVEKGGHKCRPPRLEWKKKEKQEELRSLSRGDISDPGSIPESSHGIPAWNRCTKSSHRIPAEESRTESSHEIPARNPRTHAVLTHARTPARTHACTHTFSVSWGYVPHRDDWYSYLIWFTSRFVHLIGIIHILQGMRRSPRLMIEMTLNFAAIFENVIRDELVNARGEWYHTIFAISNMKKY